MQSSGAVTSAVFAADFAKEVAGKDAREVKKPDKTNSSNRSHAAWPMAGQKAWKQHVIPEETPPGKKNQTGAAMDPKSAIKIHFQT